MNQYLTHHFAAARELELRMRLDETRIADEWHPAPKRSVVDVLGEGLVHLGVRLLSDRRKAERIEQHLHPQAA